MQNNVPLVKRNVMKPEVFILGRQRKELIRRERKDEGEGEERGSRKGAERCHGNGCGKVANN